MVLRERFGEGFDLFEQRLVIVDAGTVDEEEYAAYSSDGDEHPDVESEAEKGGGGGVCSVGGEGLLRGCFEGAYAAGGAGNKEREIDEGYGVPRTESVGDESYQASGREEDDTFGGPDEDGFDEQKKSAEEADLTDAVESEEYPVLELDEDGLLWEPGEETAERAGKGTGSKEEGEDAKGGDADGKVGP